MKRFYFYDINKVIEKNAKLKKLPIVLKILLEANLRKAKDSIEFNKILNIFSNRMDSKVQFFPSRVIMQDFTGVPALIDLVSMRYLAKKNAKDISKINPKILVDLVIDHSFNSLETNEEDEYEVYKERYEFIKWASNSFSNLRVVPPGSGICHQINLEYLSTILHIEKVDEEYFLYPETIIGTDSHTTMINSLGVLGWAVGGIEAQSSMLGLPMSLTLPKVVGINIHGILKEGITSSDLVLSLVNELKKHNLDNKVVEFYGEALEYLTLEDRSVISSMAPEYSAVCSFFAIDDKTIGYFNKTRDNEDFGKLIKKYLEIQHLFNNKDEVLDYDELIEFDLSKLEPTISRF